MRESRFGAALFRFATFVLVLSATTPGRATQPPDTDRETWRLELFHTGGLGLEVFARDRIVVEPLPWPGQPSGDLDPTGAGKYRFEVRDEGGEVRFSRGFASIYGEWETTAEAREQNRTFHESLRFPEPDGMVEVVLEKRDDTNAFVEVWRTHVDPADPLLDRAHPPRHELLEIAVHEERQGGGVSPKLDLLLLGDGYTAEQCRGKFRADAERLAEVLFSYQPFERRRADINVWGLCPPSAEAGVARPSSGIHRRSAIGATYDAFGSERYVLTFENRSWRDVAAWAPYEYVEVLVNNETYGGGGILNQFGTVAVDNDWANYVFIHELAHHLAGLADEYYTSPVAYEPQATVVEPWEPNVTALLDPGRLKWADLVSAGAPVPTPWPKDAFETHARGIQARRERIRAERRPEAEMSALFREQQAVETELLRESEHAGTVGAFRGANYDALAFYRPQIDCVMFTRNAVPFCAVCERALEQIIDWHSGRAAD
jgi:hypothetical protein